jgi:hypothetical protein
MALDTTIGGAATDSYGTLAAYQDYGTANGWTLGADDAADEVNLRRAAVYIDRKYEFVGIKQYQFQARSWPRLVRDLVDDWPIDPDTIPDDIISAQFEVAYLLQGGLDPFATIEASGTSEMIKVGPITISGDTLPTGTPRIVAIEGLLRGYIKGGAGQINMRRG